MPLLIDGHNLIGRMSDVNLDDPDDEARLVSRLKAYCIRNRKRATVVFDQGMPGGSDLALSNSSVQVVFAPAGRTADGILRERIARARDPRGLIVVSSDLEIVSMALSRGARPVRSEDFARELMPAAPNGEGAKADADVPPDDVAYWMRQFKQRDGEPRRENAPARRRSRRQTR